MATANEILGRMRDALTLSDPQWDVTVGTPTYKILESVALEIAGVFNHSLLQDYHFDVDTKYGEALDDFVELFGITRLRARRATGTVTFSRGTMAEQDHPIPIGTQVFKPSSTDSPAILFQTTVAGLMQVGQVQVEIPVEAVVAGSSGNVPEGAISALGAAVVGVSTVLNEGPTTGGRDTESDSALRQRWRATVFRSVSGTEDQFLAVALDNASVSRAMVVGATETVNEQLTVGATSPGEMTSQVTDVKYRYPVGSEFLGTNLGTESEDLAVRSTDYLWDPATGRITIVSGKYSNGDVVEFQHEYIPLASRNDPNSNIYHKVDVFIAGERARSAQEQVTMPDHVASSFGTLGASNWLRENGSNPDADDVFMPLFNTPLITVPDQLIVPENLGAGKPLRTYTLNTDYYVVREDNNNFGSPRARDGIGWVVPPTHADGIPVAGEDIAITYTYNYLVREIDEYIKRLRLLNVDTLVHRARYVYLNFNLAVQFTPASNPGSETQKIASALTAWLEAKDFRDSVQISDVIETVHSVRSVDNVRLVTSLENPTNYGIQRISEDGQTVLTSYTNDFYMNSDEVPVLFNVSITPKGRNSF